MNSGNEYVACSLHDADIGKEIMHGHVDLVFALFFTVHREGEGVPT